MSVKSDDLLTVAETAQLLGLTPATIRHLVDRGSLPAQLSAHRTRRTIRFRRSEIEAWVENQGVQPGDLATWYSGGPLKVRQRTG